MSKKIPNAFPVSRDKTKAKRKSYLAANFMPQSSEQYLELGLAPATQFGPRH